MPGTALKVLKDATREHIATCCRRPASTAVSPGGDVVTWPHPLRRRDAPRDLGDSRRAPRHAEACCGRRAEDTRHSKPLLHHAGLARALIASRAFADRALEPSCASYRRSETSR